MAKTVLDVGNCAADHAQIKHMLGQSFDVRVLRALRAEDAIGALRSHGADLVLVNRRFHADASDGLELIRRIKTDTALASTPVMLLSNYRPYQAAAVALGAEPGFGKAELDSQTTRQRLARFLDETDPAQTPL